MADDGQEYEILTDTLGFGGQGTVFRARRVADGHEVAVKRIAAAAPRELEIAEKVMSLGQPEQLLVPFASASDGPDLLLFMPLALEGSLADEIAARPGGWDESEVLAIVHDIVAGLIELNAAGIVHRDLKPANILLYQGRWHLADFGMSRDLDVRTATLTYTMGGTPCTTRRSDCCCSRRRTRATCTPWA
ncbi:protein kinase family protein [Catenulispora yoronensis]